MLNDRLALSLFLIPTFAWVFAEGGWLYALVMTGALVLATREYLRIFQVRAHRPAPALLVGVPVLALCLAYLPGQAGPVLGAFITAALVWHLADYERGAPNSATDLALTLTGLIYLGWMGGHFMLLRDLPNGLWWTSLVLPAVWAADSGGYIAGRAWGKHLLAPRLSPKKTWEGFAGGVVFGMVIGALIGTLGAQVAQPPHGLSVWVGLALGALAGLVAPIGDLGISMFKRETGIKDTGQVLAGHGGVLDRIDSWFIAAPVCYYLIVWWLQYPH